MTWVFLTNKKRNEISHKSGPYVADCFAPHEAEVRRLNPRDDWVGLTDEERDPIRSKFIGRLHDVADVLAEFEAKLKEKNMKDEDDDIQVYQRPWVGLTEEEVDTIYQRHGTPKGFAKTIEAKLKEKNT